MGLAVYEFLLHVKEAALAVYFKQFGQIIGISSDHELGEWQVFNSVPNCMDIGHHCDR